MAEKKNIPALRFPEFEGQWVKKKLGDLLEFKNGINASKEQYGKGIKFINVLDILNNDFITHDKIIGSVDVDEEIAELYSVKYGDILFQRSSETREEVGTANVYVDKDNNATFGGFVIRGRKINEYVPIFLNKLLKTDSARDEITSKSGGSTRYNVGQGILSSVELLFPSLPEQEKIATFLTAIDKRINLLSKQKMQLELYKKGLMHKIFSQELRFIDDSGNNFPEWEEKKLGDVVEINKGEQLNKDELTEVGKYPCINGGISPSGFTDKFNCNENTIAMSEGGASCGYLNFIKTKFWSGGHCYTFKLKDKDGLKTSYLFQLLKNYETEIMKLRVGSGLPNIQKKDIVQFKIKFSNSAIEQQKIANCLSFIDNQIEKVSEQISMSLEYKKGLLQQMFV